MMQFTYGTNYGMLITESIFELIFLLLVTNFINKITIPEENERFEDDIRKLLQVSIISSLIAFGIILAIRLIFGIFWLFDYGFWRIEFFFAGMLTIYFPFLIILSKRLVPRYEEYPLFRKKLTRIYLVFIGISWLVGLIFLSIDLLEIPMNWDPRDTQYDEFLLGFLWAFFAVIFDMSLLYIINIARPIEKKLPKDVFNKS